MADGYVDLVVHRQQSVQAPDVVVRQELRPRHDLRRGSCQVGPGDVALDVKVILTPPCIFH